MALVLGIDSSTTATKAIAWDPDGRLVGEGRAPVPMATPVPGWFEQSPEDWWQALALAIRDLGRQVDLGQVEALAISNQRETVGFLDADGQEIRPSILWLDERGREDIEALVAKVGRDRLLALSGKAPDPTPAIYSIHWLQRREPEAFARIAHVVDVHGYLVWRLTGARVTSRGSADPHGLLDLEAGAYAPELLDAVGLRPDQLFPVVAPGSVVGRLTADAAAATGLPAGTVVAAGGGDGQAAGLGTATLGAGRAYLNLGTAAVSGVWSRQYRTDAAFRTLTSLSSEGFILELCLRTGSFLTDWMVGRVFGGDPATDPGIYERLEAEAKGVPPGCEGLLLLPYWSGAMPPFWDPDARGLILGLGVGHGRGHLYRALMEGVALDLAMGYAAIEELTGEPVDELVAIGGGARSPLWRQIVADATGKRVTVSTTVEASCLGAGMLAAHGAGWHPTIEAAARAMQGAVDTTAEPDPERAGIYGRLLPIYRDIYPAMQATYARLAAFRTGTETP